MSVAVVTDKTERMAAASPRLTARLAGVLYALEGTGSVIGGAYFRDKFIVAGNAAATTSAIQTNEALFRFGFAAGLLAVAFHLAYTVLFYDLFRPVNRSIALVAASVSVAACALQAVASLFQLAALLVAGGGSSLSAFTKEQVQDLTETGFSPPQAVRLEPRRLGVSRREPDVPTHCLLRISQTE